MRHSETQPECDPFFKLFVRVSRTTDQGTVFVLGCRFPEGLYDEDVVTFEDNRGAYSQADAEGFIRLNALRLGAKLGRDLTGCVNLPSGVLGTDRFHGNWWVTTFVLTMTFTIAGNDQ